MAKSTPNGKDLSTKLFFSHSILERIVREVWTGKTNNIFGNAILINTVCGDWGGPCLTCFTGTKMEALLHFPDLSSMLLMLLTLARHPPCVKWHDIVSNALKLRWSWSHDMIPSALHLRCPKNDCNVSMFIAEDLFGKNFGCHCQSTNRSDASCDLPWPMRPNANCVSLRVILRFSPMQSESSDRFYMVLPCFTHSCFPCTCTSKTHFMRTTHLQISKSPTAATSNVLRCSLLPPDQSDLLHSFQPAWWDAGFPAIESKASAT